MDPERKDAVFAALSDPTRRRILELLRESPRPVELLAEGFSMSRPAVSKHLAALHAAGLVVRTPRGRQNFYEIDAGPLRQIEAWLHAFWADRLDMIKRISEGDA